MLGGLNLSASVEEIYKVIPMFASLANRQTGVCSVDKFAQNLGLVLSEPVEKLFNLFDLEKNGEFLLKDFIKTYFLLINKLDREKSIEKILNTISYCFVGDSCSTQDLRLSIIKKYNVELILFDNMSDDKLNTGNFISNNYTLLLR